MLNHSRFQLVPWIETANGRDEIVALEVSILGFIFVLLLGPLDPEQYPVLAAAKYRPGRIEIQYPRSISWVTISWDDAHQHGTLTVQHVKAVSAADVAAQDA